MQNLECHSMGENTSEVVCTGDSGEQIEHCNENHKNGLSFILSKLQICRLIYKMIADKIPYVLYQMDRIFLNIL